MAEVPQEVTKKVNTDALKNKSAVDGNGRDHDFLQTISNPCKAMLIADNGPLFSLTVCAWFWGWGTVSVLVSSECGMWRPAPAGMPFRAIR